MGRPSDAYRPRDPAASALYHVVRDHFETFRAHAAGLRDGEGLPGFVEEEFRDFLRCGWLAGGFARLRCSRCRSERLVAFSCKGRGFCPSCGDRRMAERAAQPGERRRSPGPDGGVASARLSGSGATVDPPLQPPTRPHPRCQRREEKGPKV